MKIYVGIGMKDGLISSIAWKIANREEDVMEEFSDMDEDTVFISDVPENIINEYLRSLETKEE